MTNPKWMFRDTEDVFRRYTDELYWLFFDMGHTEKYDVGEYKEVADEFLRRFIKTFFVFMVGNQIEDMTKE